ncbi:MAG TPA: DUF3500 domain-containing protein [Vicinamibacterales bacterium]|nr:DUF3500 domain-containing protein [Vicinamibacterales bacterium]
MRISSRLTVNAGLLAVLGVAVFIAPAVARQRAAAEMAKAANEFVSSLTGDQRTKAVYPMSSEEWTRWNFIPASMFPRNGISFKELNQTQRQRAHDLMKASLSQTGYHTAASVMQLENVLREIEGPSATAAAPPPAAQAAPPAPAAAPAADPAAGERGGARGGGGQRGGRGGRGGGDGAGAPIIRDPELYYLTVFGDPSAKTAWGWRLEGHHVSLRFAVDNGKLLVSSTPQFLGSNPAEVPYGYGPFTGLRVLAAQEDAARTLVLALDAKRQAIAIVAPNPRGFASGTTVKFDPQTPVGLPMSQMTAGQRDMLMKLIDSYASIMPADIAAARLAKIKSAGTDTIAFAWSGSTEKGRQYQYQVQGPTFLIEHNNTQNNGNHIHAVWRDFNGDFGRDVLAEHMAALPH